ncbi:MAG: DUF2061 domain-containing protein [Candidatus Saccharimonadales bacterium]
MAKNKKHHDHWRRSLAKTLTYRIVILVMMMVITITVTHSKKQALEITGWNAVLATIIYYFHERMWSRIKWGRN